MNLSTRPAVSTSFSLPVKKGCEVFEISSFTTGPGATTLPMKIYSQVRLGVTPEINAICTILIALVTLGVIATSIGTKRAEVRRIRDEHMALRTGS